MGVMIFRDCPENEGKKVWITNEICDESKKCCFAMCSFHAFERTIKEDEAVAQEPGLRRMV